VRRRVLAARCPQHTSAGTAVVHSLLDLIDQPPRAFTERLIWVSS
jgi:hypothetical protein